MTAESWLEVGRALGRVRGSVMWWVGDWWAYGEHRYGERAGAVRAEDWEGPKFQTCVNAGVVCRRFESNSRELVVSFRVHQAIASIADDEWRLKTLAWAATSNKDGKRPTVAATEDRVKEVRAQLSQGWTPDQLDRKARAEIGECVVANIRNDETGNRRIDEALLCWAEAQDLFVRIDRNTEWGNPFEMPGDGDRDTVCRLYGRFYLPNKPSLLKKAPSLQGKVVGCWCHPQQCHGHLIAEVVNREAAGDGTASEIALMIAEDEG
jgi:hypothetical protein